jgi:mRNA-degrading endonuclease RelE of RelBE toxin-antitoxin system
VKFSDQVAATLRELHPGVRKDIRRGLAEIDSGKRRDIAGLTGRLAGFSRLRVGRYRIVFRYDESGELVAEFLGTRATVYAAAADYVQREDDRPPPMLEEAGVKPKIRGQLKPRQRPRRPIRASA